MGLPDAAPPAPPRDHRLAGRTAQRRLGAFYTAAEATRAMAEWALRGPRDRVLEPSFGGGAFLSAVHAVRDARGLHGVELFGAELVEETFATAVEAGLVERERSFQGDFLAVEPFPVDVVIGNPPYVRLRHLPAEQEQRARAVAAEALGRPMEASGSVWMPFVLHALRFLRPGGRLALVLPFDLTYVKYARPLWTALGESFASLRLVRVHERLFPEILQDVVVLFAEGYRDGRTDHVDFVALDRAAYFADATTHPGAPVCIRDVSAGDRAFMRALLDPALLELLATRVIPATVPVRDRCAFHIGYVTGHKGYFHPTPDDVRAYGLPARSLRAAATTSRQLTGLGLHTSALREPDQLFLPDPAALTEGEQRYIASGIGCVDGRYKCRVREPWYVVPGVHVPDLVLSVFSERPVVLLNDAGLVATNSLLCGSVREGTAESFVAAWYTSLTPLLCELEVHALGGGVLVLVPGEVASVRIAPDVPAPAEHLAELDRRLASGDPEGAYLFGDDLVLRGRLGLGDEEIALLRRGAATLRWWRTSARGGEGTEAPEEGPTRYIGMYHERSTGSRPLPSSIDVRACR